MKIFLKISKIALYILLAILLAILFLSFRKNPEHITYGVSFNIPHAEELGLSWKEVYQAMLSDLKVKHLRLSAEWSLVELEHDSYSFTDLDYQMTEAKAHGVDVILAVGKKTPGWPECHEPAWEQALPEEHKQDHLFDYIQTVVNRYKGASNLKYWQVENEPFLNFATTQCGAANKSLVEREVTLVKQIDPTHNVVVTDGGEFGLWGNAWGAGDVFGTSEYLYIWQHFFGPMRYPIGPAFFKVKLNLSEMLYGKKPEILSELGMEPWLLTPIAETPIGVQLQRMDIVKFNEILNFAKGTSLDTQYLWGVEWWYWMKQHGHPEFWDKAKNIYEVI